VSAGHDDVLGIALLGGAEHVERGVDGDLYARQKNTINSEKYRINKQTIIYSILMHNNKYKERRLGRGLIEPESE
jgi:hypothetical protein